MIVVTGMGKAGLIGRKITATLSSTGTRAHFLHPAEAAHGDLGCLADDDVLIVLSNSGETEEVCRILPSVTRFGIPIIAITASRASTVGRSAAATIELGRLREAGPHALAPSTTTTAMLAVGDALALVVGRRKGFTPQQFALYHSGGSLGAMLKSVGEIMRTGAQLRIAEESKSIRNVFAESSRPGRRTGAVILIDAAGRLSGLFTDSDLARLLERRQDGLLDRPIAESMTRHPLTTGPDILLSEAIEILSHNRISELPVVDGDGRPLGILDVTDVVAAGLRQRLNLSAWAAPRHGLFHHTGTLDRPGLNAERCEARAAIRRFRFESPCRRPERTSQDVENTTDWRQPSSLVRSSSVRRSPSERGWFCS